MDSVEMKELAAKLSPEEAISLHHALENANGWAGTVFQRSDVECAAGRDLTDEEWAKVCESYEWNKGVPERTTERGWEVIYDMVDFLKLKNADDSDGHGVDMGDE